MSTEKRLSAAGVFKGHGGLRGLAESQGFWQQQPYETRLYFGDGGGDYLHRSILKAAVKAMDEDYAELTALRAENKRLRALVQEFSDAASHLCLVMVAHKVDSINRDLQKAADRLADLAWEGDKKRAQQE